MNSQTLLTRPAQTALAAALALVSTPSLAQNADPAAASVDPSASIVVPSEQPAPSPALPTIAPPQIMVAPPPAATAQTPAVVPVLPQIAPAPSRVARAQAAPAPRAEPAAPREARAAAPAAQPRVVTPVPVTPATEAAPPAQSSLPILPPPELAGPETTPVEAAPAPVATPTNNEGVYWALGGGVALLLGIGAFAFLHRRDRKEEASKHALLAEPAFSQRVQPTAAVGPTPSTPVPHVPEPQDYAAAPRWSPSATKASADSRFPELEAMVAERPSSENPFVTRRARLRRAEFIHRMGHAPQGPAIATHTPEAAIQAPRKRPQQVYNFGTGAVSFRPQGWKPATT